MRIGRLGIVDEAHAALFADKLAAVGQSLEAAQRLFDLLGSDPERARRGIGGAGVLVVMRTGQPRHLAQVDRRHLPPLAPLCQKALAGKDRPAIPLQLRARRHADHPVILGPLPHLVGKEGVFVIGRIVDTGREHRQHRHPHNTS